VDDCSTDNSYNVVEDYISDLKDYNITLLRNDSNSGPSATRNAGIRQATGKYIVCIDADDYVADNFLAENIKSAIQDNSDIVCCSMQFFGNSNAKWKASFAKGYAKKNLYRNYLVIYALYKREIWSAVGGYDEKMKGYEDWDFWIKCNLAGYKRISIINKVLYFYRKHGKSISDGVELGKRDKTLKARIILNHSEAYSPLYCRWAEDILRGDEYIMESTITRFGMPFPINLKLCYSASMLAKTIIRLLVSVVRRLSHSI
jgi:glycosyltransferase involved in cell wall biosynthesis